MPRFDELTIRHSPLRRLPDFIQLMRLDRPIGIYLLLWPTLWALWIASEGLPPFKLLLLFMGGVFLTRTGSYVMNDFAERHHDGHITGTRNHPLATGRISSKEALTLAVALGLIAFILVLFTNQMTILLSFGGLLLICIYPYMKRYTYFPQAVLGAAFAWAIPMAFAAVAQTVPLQAWLLYLATLLWAIAYDTFYAMISREDDVKAGIKSTALLFGEADLLMIGILNGLALLALIFVGNKLQFSHWYYLGLAVATALWIWQLWRARGREPENCYKAFLHNHWVGAAVFAGIFLHFSLS